MEKDNSIVFSDSGLVSRASVLFERHEFASR